MASRHRFHELGESRKRKGGRKGGRDDVPVTFVYKGGRKGGRDDVPVTFVYKGGVEGGEVRAESLQCF